MSQKKLWVKKNFQLQKNLVKQNLGSKRSKNNLGLKKFRSKEILGLKDNSGPKMFGQNSFMSKKRIWVQNIFGSKINLRSKEKLGPKNFWVQTNFESKNFGSHKF